MKTYIHTDGLTEGGKLIVTYGQNLVFFAPNEELADFTTRRFAFFTGVHEITVRSVIAPVAVAGILALVILAAIS